MPELIHPDDRPDAAERFRADLAGYLRERSGPELADLERLPDPVKADLISQLARRGCPIPTRSRPTPGPVLPRRPQHA